MTSIAILDGFTAGASRSHSFSIKLLNDEFIAQLERAIKGICTVRVRTIEVEIDIYNKPI